MSSPRDAALGRALRVMVDEMRAEPAPEPAWDERDEMERQLVIVESEQVGAPQLCDSEGHPL